MKTVPQSYRPPHHPAPVKLDLSGRASTLSNEHADSLLSVLRAHNLHDYPRNEEIENCYAKRLDIDANRVLVTAGADEAIDRICRLYLRPGLSAVLTKPGFVMIPRYIELSGAKIRAVTWTEGPFPRQDFCNAGQGLDAISDLCVSPPSRAPVNPPKENPDRIPAALAIVVSPNNPTGAVISAKDLSAILRHFAPRPVLVDLAYGEYADEDLLSTALSQDNAIVIRTLSKAWGLPGIRVGFVISNPETIAKLRSCGGPYSVSGPSLAIAQHALEHGDKYLKQQSEAVKKERRILEIRAHTWGFSAPESQGNFVLFRGKGSRFLRDGLAGLGIATRLFQNPGLKHGLRITCPGQSQQFQWLSQSIATVLRPEALLLDMDGVLSDVSQSYRRAIIQSAAHFGVSISAQDIQWAKEAGNANDDWALTQRLLDQAGVFIPLEEVTEVFEGLYQGGKLGRPTETSENLALDGNESESSMALDSEATTIAEPNGLWRRERLIPPRDGLKKLADRIPLGIVTGRPRRDAERFLTFHEIDGLFRVVVCREDAPLKPDPAPLRLAQRKLGFTDIPPRCWYVGDTPDDMVAARAAGMMPLGIDAPGTKNHDAVHPLLASGGSQVLADFSQLYCILEELFSWKS